MSDFGLTPQGFKRKKYDDIIADMEASARNLFGENVNLSERGPLGLLIRLVAWFLGILWQLAENVYNSGFIDTAEGAQLDNVIKYGGISRRKAEKAKGTITITGDEGAIIPRGFKVATSGGIVFETMKEASIPAAGEVDISIEAVEAGTNGNVPAGTITEIVNPIPGVESVTNELATKGGRNTETDSELQNRYFLSLSAAGASTIDSIRAALLRTEGVRAANVVENNSMQTDPDGRPPKSIECYVLGGKPKDIAQTILDYKAAGIETYGKETEIVKDISGTDREIKFSYADVVPIYVKITLATDAKFPTDGEKQIIKKLTEYIGGEDADGNIYAGLNMGQKVVYTKLIDIIYNVPGVIDLDLEISKDDQVYVKQNIDTAINEVAETDSAKVVISYE